LIEKGKISALQMAMIMYTVVVATGDLIIPSFTAKYAKRDLWLSPIWAALMGLLIAAIVYHLHKLFPKETLIQYSERIIGRIAGKILGISFLFAILFINGAIVRQYSDFLTSVFFRKTPTWILVGSMVLVCALTVRGGLEAIARCAQLFVPLVILSWILIMVLLLPDMEINNMLPILAKGIMPSIRGAIPTSAWFGHFAIIAFILPYLKDPEKGMKWATISIVVIMLTLSMITIATLFIFGDITSQLTYPVMMAIRYIEVAGFIEHVESIMMAIWVIGTFIKISAVYSVFVLGFSQLMHLSDYRPVVFPSGFLLVVFSAWEATDLQKFIHYLGTSAAFMDLTFYLIIPAMLLLIALVRRRIR
jgi:spore germination protein KB